MSLFNGKDLTGWKMSDPNAAVVWKVENGTLISPGHGPEIIHNQEFQDFKLHVEFNCGADANSGVYLRGRDEVQIEDNSIQEPPSHHMGGIYGFIAHSPELPSGSRTNCKKRWSIYLGQDAGCSTRRPHFCSSPATST